MLAGGGDLAGALAAASAPELANIIGHHSGLSDNDALIAHALLGGVVASLQGKSAGAGAAGALTGELAARAIKAQLFPGKDNRDLDEADKQLVSNLATLASGLAGNIVSGNASGTTAGAQAGKNAAENNAMGATAGSDLGFWFGKTPDCDTTCKAGIAEGVAQGNLITSAVVGGVAGAAEVAIIIAGATPELAAAAQAVLAGCKSAARICLNTAGLMAAEIATPGGVGGAGILSVGKNATEVAAVKAEVAAVNAAKPGWLQNVQAGNKFNAEQSKNYPYNELYVNKPNGNGYYRVDSYNPATGEIVSRKFTQFSDITEATATNYIREAVNKYPAGASIAKVPSSGSLGGNKLEGANILEIPPQIKPIPQSVLDAADKAGVTIRDINGKIYQ